MVHNVYYIWIFFYSTGLQNISSKRFIQSIWKVFKWFTCSTFCHATAFEIDSIIFSYLTIREKAFIAKGTWHSKLHPVPTYHLSDVSTTWLESICLCEVTHRQCMSHTKPRIQGIVCWTLRWYCIEAQIWWRVQKNLCSTERPNEHNNLNGRSPPGLFRELATQPVWVVKGPKWGRWPTTQWSLSRRSSICGNRRTLEDNHFLLKSDLCGRAQGNHSTVKGILKPIWSFPTGTWKILRPWEPNYLVWWLKDWTLWPECKESCLEERGTAHRLASTMLWICLSAAGTGRLVRIEGEVNATMKMTYIPQLNFI